MSELEEFPWFEDLRVRKIRGHNVVGKTDDHRREYGIQVTPDYLGLSPI